MICSCKPKAPGLKSLWWWLFPKRPAMNRQEFKEMAESPNVFVLQSKLLFWNWPSMVFFPGPCKQSNKGDSFFPPHMWKVFHKPFLDPIYTWNFLRHDLGKSNLWAAPGDNSTEIATYSLAVVNHIKREGVPGNVLRISYYTLQRVVWKSFR